MFERELYEVAEDITGYPVKIRKGLFERIYSVEKTHPNKIGKYIAGCIGLFSLLFGSGNAGEVVTLKGKIMDRDDRPVPEATVYVQNRRKKILRIEDTDKDGSYEFQIGSGDNYYLNVMHRGVNFNKAIRIPLVERGRRVVVECGLRIPVVYKNAIAKTGVGRRNVDYVRVEVLDTEPEQIWIYPTPHAFKDGINMWGEGRMVLAGEKSIKFGDSKLRIGGKKFTYPGPREHAAQFLYDLGLGMLIPTPESNLKYIVGIPAKGAAIALERKYNVSMGMKIEDFSKRCIGRTPFPVVWNVLPVQRAATKFGAGYEYYPVVLEVDLEGNGNVELYAMVKCMNFPFMRGEHGISYSEWVGLNCSFDVGKRIEVVDEPKIVGLSKLARIDKDGWVYPNEVDRNPDGGYKYDFTDPEQLLLAIVESLNNKDKKLFRTTFSKKSIIDFKDDIIFGLGYMYDLVDVAVDHIMSLPSPKTLRYKIESMEPIGGGDRVKISVVDVCDDGKTYKNKIVVVKEGDKWKYVCDQLLMQALDHKVRSR